VKRNTAILGQSCSLFISFTFPFIFFFSADFKRHLITRGIMMDEGQYGTQGNQFGETENQDGGSPKKRIIEQITPLTIKQIYEAGIGKVRNIDGREVSMFSFVGAIRWITSQGKHETYQVEDGTGYTIDVFDFIKEEDPEAAEQIKASRTMGMYAKFIARYVPEKRFVIALAIMPISDFNQITQHFLQVICVHLYNTRGPLPYVPRSTFSQTSPTKNPQRQPQQIQNGGNQDNRQRDEHQPNRHQQQQQQQPNDQELAEQVQIFLNQNDGLGRTFQDIVAGLNGLATGAHIKGILQQMVDEQLLYNPRPDFYALYDGNQ